MSRSNPTENNPHPCSRWFEWDGSEGQVRYYDKDEKKNIVVGADFSFILLDRLSTVKGWSDKMESGIYANEVKDTRAESLVVKYFKGGVIAEGFYAQIKDRVNAAGGHFVINCYLAYYDEQKNLAIGSIVFKGAALSAWMDFEKANRKDLYTKAVRINGYDEGKKGKIVFRTPKFFIKDVSDKTNESAKALDKELQTFLDSYFKRSRVEQVNQTASHHEEDEPQEQPPERGGFGRGRPPIEYDAEESDIPF